MSSVILQVGQCGNQIGKDLWNIVLTKPTHNKSDVYTHLDGKVRCVSCDTEPKVVKQIFQNVKKSYFRSENIILGKRGRGSNWAMGYYGSKNNAEDEILGKTMEALRKEIERCDSFSGIILMHSLGGGTGSGLGSHICELFKEEYPMYYLMNCVVAPHTSGESPLQHYNSLLSLASLQRNSDCVVVFHNDDILNRIEKQRTGIHVEKKISFSDMNRHIASCLAGVILPVDNLTSDRAVSIGLEPWEMIRSVCPMPSLKFIKVNHISKRLAWNGMVKAALQSSKKFDSSGKPYAVLGNLLVARGGDIGNFQRLIPDTEKKIKHGFHCVDWNPFPVDFWLGNRSLNADNSPSLTMASNCSSIVEYAEHVIHKSQVKFQARAYLHWYEKYACPESDFEEAFDSLQTLVEDYKEAVT